MDAIVVCVTPLPMCACVIGWGGACLCVGGTCRWLHKHRAGPVFLVANKSEKFLSVPDEINDAWLGVRYNPSKRGACLAAARVTGLATRPLRRSRRGVPTPSSLPSAGSWGWENRYPSLRSTVTVRGD